MVVEWGVWEAWASNSILILFIQKKAPSYWGLFYEINSMPFLDDEIKISSFTIC